MQTFFHPGAQRLFVNIEGRIPNRREWKRIRADGTGINVLRLEDGSDSLAPLAEQAPWITHLLVNSGSVVDLSLVEQMPQLEQLGVGGLVRGEVDLIRSTLKVFGGPVESFPGVLDLPSLRDLRFDWKPANTPRIGAPVESLHVLSAAKLSSVPVLAEPSSLRQLTIHGSADLDLSGLSAFAGLTSLTLDHCRRITHADAVLDLPLIELVFEDCPDIDPIEPLAALRAERIVVTGHNPFPAEFRETAGPAWHFPPGLHR